jgi:hypothetical protein
MHSGADWLQRNLAYRGCEISVFGRKVANLLGDVFAGIYHIESAVLSRKVDWGCTYRIKIALYGGVSTYDHDLLTRLVVLAHDRCIRLEINGAAHGYLHLIFTPRVGRDADLYNRHPTMEEAIRVVRVNCKRPGAEVA